MRFSLLHRLALPAAALLTFLPAPSAHAQDGAWTSLGDVSVVPGLRREHGAIFDRAHQRYLIFNGRTGLTPETYFLFNDLWSLDVSDVPTWSHMEIGDPLPGPRHSPQWGYDAARNRLLIFGGYGKHYPDSPMNQYLNDVWELSLEGTPHWIELFPAGQTPSGRLAGAAVYDPMRQRFVGFGGTINMPVDTWVLNLKGQANWQPLPISGDRPNGGWGMTSVYDAKRDRMIVFGGATSDNYYGANNEVWELELRGVPEWHHIIPDSTPPHNTRPRARRSGAAIWDPLRDRMVIFGGFDAVPGSDQFLGDTWALDFSVDPPAWTELNPAGTLPPGRDGVPAAYDPLNDRMIVYGGWSGTEFLADTQFLEWGGVSSEALMVPQASATSALAHVEWTVQDATGPHAAIYRREAGAPWTALAEAEVGATARVIFDDATVTAGTEYEYMMVVGSERGETFGGTTAVEVPSGNVGVDPGPSVAFALRRVSPNPATSRMTISFALPSSERAMLEILDATGRRWLDREVGALGAGAHQIDLSAAQVPAGLYFLRLTQSGRSATTRVVVMSGR